MATFPHPVHSSPAASAAAGELLRLEGATKRFPGVLALDHVDFGLRAGEVHVLFGENGAGKSTLVNAVAGTYPLDEGRMLLLGDEVHFHAPHDARERGINAVFQEFSLIPTLSVGENIFLGRELTQASFLDRAEMMARATAALAELGFEIEARARIDRLSRSQQQMVEIAKALQGEPLVLILDEPTSSLTEKEADVLFALIYRLKETGLGIIYITHKIQEIWRVADRITVLRDGKRVATTDAAETSEEQLLSLMTGRDFQSIYPTIKREPGSVRLRATELRTEGDRVDGVSIEVRAGEVVGLAGLVGSGKSEVGRAIFGIERLVGGTVELNGEFITHPTPSKMLRRGLVYSPPDRRTEGLLLPRPIRENISMAALNLPTLNRGGFLRRRRERELVTGVASQLQIRPLRLERPVAVLSGGNQQKVMFSRGLLRDANVFIFDEPTTGVDVGARIEIYQLLKKLSEDGAGIVLISSDLPEILHLSHRVYVIHQGRIRSEFAGAEITEASIIEKFFEKT